MSTFATRPGPRFASWCRRCEKECDEVHVQYNLNKMGLDVLAVCHKEREVKFIPDDELHDGRNYSVGGAFRFAAFEPKGEGK